MKSLLTACVFLVAGPCLAQSNTYKLDSKAVQINAPKHWPIQSRGFPNLQNSALTDEIIFFPLPTPDLGHNGAGDFILRIYRGGRATDLKKRLKEIKATPRANVDSETTLGDLGVAMSGTLALPRRAPHSVFDVFILDGTRVLHFSCSIPILGKHEAAWRKELVQTISDTINSCKIGGKAVNGIQITEDQEGKLSFSLLKPNKQPSP